MTDAPLIELRHVTVVRDLERSAPRPALDDVSLSIGAGEHVCILGPNGCGKSTLIKTITRECYPLTRAESSVRILGRDRWNVFELRTKLGIVTPDLLAACSTDATGRDIVLSGFFSSTRIFRHHAPDPAQATRADELLVRFGVAHLADVAVARMSSGEAKRVLIAALSCTTRRRCCSTNRAMRSTSRPTRRSSPRCHSSRAPASAWCS